MTERIYPYKAWALQPSFKPIEVELVRRQWAHSYADWDSTEAGKGYHIFDLYASKNGAIDAGRAKLEKLEADLAKRTEGINKKRAALDKAEAA